jgi:hypothetical protein
MRRITLTLIAIVIATATCTIKAQDEAQMKAWMDYMTPGEAHKIMSSWDGNWTADISMWMAPGTEATKSTGTSSNKMALGGRYQVGTFSGSFSGMPFEGMSLLGYDNSKKVFESIWIDNMGTGVMHLTGPWDPKTKTITLTGKMMDAMSGKEVAVKETFRITDDNTQIMEMYAPGPDGKEFKTMEIKYTRKK